MRHDQTKTSPDLGMCRRRGSEVPDSLTALTHPLYFPEELQKYKKQSKINNTNNDNNDSMSHKLDGKVLVTMD